MSHRTPAQFAADRRRSHKAQAKRQQKQAAWAFDMTQKLRANGYTSTLDDVAAMYAATARRHLNFVLTGTYADFV